MKTRIQYHCKKCNCHKSRSVSKTREGTNRVSARYIQESKHNRQKNCFQGPVAFSEPTVGKRLTHCDSSKKIIKFRVDKEAIKELNKLQDRLFGDLTKDQKKMLGIKKFKQCTMECLYG